MTKTFAYTADQAHEALDVLDRFIAKDEMQAAAGALSHQLMRTRTNPLRMMRSKLSEALVEVIVQEPIRITLSREEERSLSSVGLKVGYPTWSDGRKRSDS